MAQTLKDRLIAHGWTQEDADAPVRAAFVSGDWSLSPRRRIADKAEWARLRIALRDLLPVGAAVRCDGIEGTVEESEKAKGLRIMVGGEPVVFLGSESAISEAIAAEVEVLS